MSRARRACPTIVALLLVTSPAIASTEETPQTQAALRTFDVENATIVALSDGWVEVVRRSRPELSLYHDEYVSPRERFRADSVLKWVMHATARAQFASPFERVERGDTLGSGEQSTLFSGLFRLSGNERDGLGYSTMGPTSWSTQLVNCLRANPSHSLLTLPSLSPPLDFIAAMDSAARVASAFRSDPARISAIEPFDMSRVACPAVLKRKVMPQEVQRGAPREVLAEFVVTATGHVDTATVEFHPVLENAQRLLATAAMVQWIYEPAQVAGISVAVRMHHPITFRDTTLAENRSTGFGMFENRGWVLRSDGLIERRSGLGMMRGQQLSGYWNLTATGPHVETHSEVFQAQKVKEWIGAVQRLRDSARRVPAGLDGPPQPQWMFRVPPGPWSATLGSGSSRRVTVSAARDTAPGSEIYLNAQLSQCGNDSVASLIGTSSETDIVVKRAEVFADSALLIGSAASVDSLRLYGETEVTCEARPLDSGTTVRDIRERAISASLALSRDAVVSFVVGRDGRVDPNAIHVMGRWSDSERRSIAAAVSSIPYAPGRFGGVAVAQQVHYLIRAL